MEEIQKEILKTLHNLVKKVEYQEKLLEEIVMARDESKHQKEKVLDHLNHYREMMKNSPLVKSNPELAKVINGMFEGMTPPEG